MELLIQPHQFVIKYTPQWMFILLLSGLVLFFFSKYWREQLKRSHKHSYMPGVLFAVSFIFLIGGINLFVFKIVFNKEGITLFNIQHFNQHIAWQDISRVEYQQQQIALFWSDANEPYDSVMLDLAELPEESMNKVKILIELKTRKIINTVKNGEKNTININRKNE